MGRQGLTTTAVRQSGQGPALLGCVHDLLACGQQGSAAAEPQAARRSLRRSKKDGGISFQDQKYEQLRIDLRWTNTYHVRRGAHRRSGRMQLTLPGFAAEVADALHARGHILLVDNHTPGTIVFSGDLAHVRGAWCRQRERRRARAIGDGSLVERADYRISVAEFVDHHIAMLGHPREARGGTQRASMSSKPSSDATAPHPGSELTHFRSSSSHQSAQPHPRA